MNNTVERWDSIKVPITDIFQPVAFELGLTFPEALFLTYVYELMDDSSEEHLDFDDTDYIRADYFRFIMRYPLAGLRSTMAVASMVDSLYHRNILIRPKEWGDGERFIAITAIPEDLLYLLFVSDYSMTDEVFEEWEDYRTTHGIPLPDTQIEMPDFWNHK